MLSMKLYRLILLAMILISTKIAYSTPVFYTFGSMGELNQFSGLLLKNPASAYHQASELVNANSSLTVSVFYANQDLQINSLARPSGVDISDEIYQARVPTMSGLANLKNTPLPSNQISPRNSISPAFQDTFFQIASTSSLLKEGHHRLNFGILISGSASHVEKQNPRFTDERAQYFGNSLFFSKWGNYLDGLSTALALSWSYQDLINLGVGVVILNQAKANSEVFLSDATYQGNSYTLANVTVKNSFSPYFSASGRLLKNQNQELRWGLNYYTAQDTTVEGTGNVKIWGFAYAEGQNSLKQKFTQHYRYLPSRYQASLSWKIKEWGFYSILEHVSWSQYLDYFGESTGWVDQWQGTWGGQYQKNHYGFGLDIRWRPSPVKPQIGRRNDIDPSQLAFAGNIQLQPSKSIKFSLGGQLHYLLTQSAYKSPYASQPVIDEVPDQAVNISSMQPINQRLGLQTNNPGFPGWKASGMVWVLSLSMHFFF